MDDRLIAWCRWHDIVIPEGAGQRLTPRPKYRPPYMSGVRRSVHTDLTKPVSLVRCLTAAPL